MFRRNPDKDNSLFDTTDAVQDSLESLDAQSTTISSASTAAASAPFNASSTMAAPAVQTSAPLSRPVSDMRPSTTPQTAGAFRTAAPIQSDRSRLPETKSSLGSITGTDKANKSGRRVLTVGNDILLKGEIATCDRLVIEGKVDASLNDVHTVEIAETGSFKGSANIEDAEISGLFEGDLVVRNRLVIYATGKVRGKISYGEIEIERGGELTGEIKTTTPVSATSARPARVGAKADDKVAA